MLECDLCGGDGCALCGGTGEIEIPHCPKALVDEGVGELLSLVKDAEEGALPCGGGVGDQTAYFLAARSAVLAERAACEREEEEDRRRQRQ